MASVSCELNSEDRDQLQNPMLLLSIGIVDYLYLLPVGQWKMQKTRTKKLKLKYESGK